MWGWIDKAYMKNTKYGAPPNVKMTVAPFPKVNIESNFLPPKIVTDTIMSEEEDKEVENVLNQHNYEEIGVVPLDGEDPTIYSTEVGVAPYSFLDENTKYNKKAPPPTYIAYPLLSEAKPVRKNRVLNGLEVNKDGVLQCVDKVMLEKSKGVVSYVIKQIAKNIFSGLGVVAISLPVRIFEPRSALERVLDGFSFAPKYLSDA